MTKRKSPPGADRSVAAARRAKAPARKRKADGEADAREPDEQAEAGPEAAEPIEPEIVEPEVVGEGVAAEAEEEAGSAPAAALPVRVERDLSSADALQRYMAEVSRHPLLTREEEHALAAEFAKTRDPRLAYRLVTANLRLVVKIAHEYRRAAFSLLDLIQEGNVGLMQAVNKYDPFRGVKLSSYAAWWIRAYILRYLMDNWRMVKLGTTQAQRKLFFNLRKEQERLAAQGFTVTPKLLAERLDVSEQDVREMDQRLSNDEFSLDAPVQGSSDESRQTHMDRLQEMGQSPDEALAGEELRQMLREKLEEFRRTLSVDKDRWIFDHRISAEEPLTLQQVGDHFGVTRERARQLEARLMDRLREFLRDRLPDFAQLSVNPPEEP